ncbi:MAG: arylsulfatase [Verrucomicrobiae bacterium]|nr:arylsulfatase [Verrucomicrobiae bacterium]MCP5541059.1 arylsulfatase [Akkermansiaceae bacterium]
MHSKFARISSRKTVFAACLAVLGALAGFAAAATAPRPNIVVFLADDLGWSDLGCYGGEIPTPRVDSLAEHGIRFTQFYNNAVCGPTRASLLTGLYCQQVGHAGTRWNDPRDYSRCLTLGEMLQGAGYHTMMTGKWQGREQATERGFHRYFGPQTMGKISYFDEVDLDPFFLDGKRWPVPRDGSFYLTEALGDHAVEFLEDHLKGGDTDRAPFFLYFAFIAPHWPLHAREADIAPHRERYQAGWDRWNLARHTRQMERGLFPKSTLKSPAAWPTEVPRWDDAVEHAWQAERMAVYAAQVAGIDRQVGRVLDLLDRHGVADNTLVLFLSDNGAAPDGGVSPSESGFGFGPEATQKPWRLDGKPISPGGGPARMPGPRDTFAAYGLGWATVSSTPLRGTKMTAWEGGIRTPLVARWPAGIDASRQGAFSDTIGHVMDFMPTFVDLSGAQYPAEFQGRHPLPMEGRSLAPAFRGEPRGEAGMLCWSAPRNQAIRAGRWKLVNPDRDSPWELYDLETDATETTNLAARYPERVTELREKWLAWARRVSE